MAATMDAMAPSMPGSYLFQYEHNHKYAASHNVYQPPAHSPSPAPRCSQIPRPVSRSSTPSLNRKRPRLDTNTSYFSRPRRPSIHTRSNTAASTPFSLDGSYDHVTYNNYLESSVHSSEDFNPVSPSPLANSHYRLAEGLDTPSASVERVYDEFAQCEAERDYRFNRYSTTNTSRTTISVNGSSQFLPNSISTIPSTSSSNSRKRPRSTTSLTKDHSLTGWAIRSTAWALTGGLAGRVFNFCLNTAFRGFGAGGGESHTVEQNISTAGGAGFDQMSLTMGSTNESHHDFGGFVEDYMNSPEARKQTERHTPITEQSQWDVGSMDGSILKNDWQIVDQVNMADNADASSPARKRSRASVASTWQRPSSRTSTAGRVNSVHSASHASPRAGVSTNTHQLQRTTSSGPFQPVRRSRPSLAQPRRSQSTFPAIGRASTGQLSPERPSSSASMRQNQPGISNHKSQLSPEVVDYRRKVKQREKAQNENFERLNTQLRDMIREGREALGSKVEIFDEYGAASNNFDEGFYEDAWR